MFTFIKTAKGCYLMPGTLHNSLRYLAEGEHDNTPVLQTKQNVNLAELPVISGGKQSKIVLVESVYAGCWGWVMEEIRLVSWAYYEQEKQRADNLQNELDRLKAALGSITWHKDFLFNTVYMSSADAEKIAEALGLL